MTDTDDAWETYKQSVKREEIKRAHHVASGVVGAGKKRPPKETRQILPRTKDAKQLPKVDGKLDLHGCTQDVAYEKLAHFVKKGFETEAGRLLLVTGRGKDGTSVLRLNAPRWCLARPLAPYVASVTEAEIGHGGDGALYILLKRKKRE